MSSRRLRPVAALTLAVIAAPFLAATAVAATAGAARPADAAIAPNPGLERLELLARATASVREAAVVTAAAAAAAVPETPPPPPPPPPPHPDDLSTWVWPGDGPVTSLFGRRWGRMHEGVDIDAPYGSVVRAAHVGTVVSAGWENGYGQMVRIDHGNGVESRYAHLASMTVTAGQAVARGQQIGTVGATGSVTAAHLHYEIRIGGAAQNPSAWLPPGGVTAGNPG